MNSEHTDPMEILVVDDNIDAAESLGEVLEACGHHVRLAFSGAEALTAFRAASWGLVLMDLKMPEMNGVEVIRHIRAIRQDARIVVVTGNTVREDIDEAMAAGAMGLLRKPFKVPDLLQIIAQQEA